MLQYKHIQQNRFLSSIWKTWNTTKLNTVSTSNIDKISFNVQMNLCKNVSLEILYWSYTKCALQFDQVSLPKLPGNQGLTHTNFYMCQLIVMVTTVTALSLTSYYLLTCISFIIIHAPTHYSLLVTKHTWNNQHLLTQICNN